MIKKTISRPGDAERRGALEISARQRSGCVELVTAFNYQSNVFLFIILTDFAIQIHSVHVNSILNSAAVCSS